MTETDLTVTLIEGTTHALLSTDFHGEWTALYLAILIEPNFVTWCQKWDILRRGEGVVLGEVYRRRRRGVEEKERCIGQVNE